MLAPHPGSQDPGLWIQLVPAGGQPLPRHRPQRRQLRLIVGGPDVLDIARPRREECTICTALAPDAVFTVRTYATVGSLETTV